MKNAKVGNRNGAATAVAVALLAAILFVVRGSGGVDPLQSQDAKNAGGNVERQHATRKFKDRPDGAKWILKVGAARVGWDLRIPSPSNLIYVSNDGMNASASSTIPPVGDTPRPGKIKTGEPLGDTLHDVIAPNVAQATALDPAGAFEMSKTFVTEVERRLSVPPAAQSLYGAKLQQALQENAIGSTANEYVVLVDRSQNVQALFIYFRAKADGIWQMLGATPVSTGLPGSYDHFVTPVGVFQHTPRNMDFRSEGTLNGKRSNNDALPKLA